MEGWNRSMERQLTFSTMEYDSRKFSTTKSRFLEMMDAKIDWKKWCAIIEPFYFEGKRGRPPVGLERMLRMYLLQVWFSLSDRVVEDEINEGLSFRKFMGLSTLDERSPDATTLCNFRAIIEDNCVDKMIFESVNETLDANGVVCRGGTIMDSTHIAAPSSTKNSTGERDPEMHSAKKSNQWHFGMKIHIGVDAVTGYVHTAAATSANVHDVAVASQLIRPDDHVVYGDSGYLGIQNREEVANDEHLSQVEFRINCRPSQIRIPANRMDINWDKKIESQKSSVRCKVEHAFLIVKRQFGYAKTAYRGLKKNLGRFYMLLASANIVMYCRSGRTEIPAL